jgi:hypothetical protein
MKRPLFSLNRAKDEMRREYRRSDFPRLERGKFDAAVAKGMSACLACLASLYTFVYKER